MTSSNLGGDISVRQRIELQDDSYDTIGVAARSHPDQSGVKLRLSTGQRGKQQRSCEESTYGVALQDWLSPLCSTHAAVGWLIRRTW